MSGSAGQQRVSSEFFYKFKVEDFSKIEQESISDILDLLDIQIHETGAIINKLQQVKQGLLHDLLTRGVDENGELRTSYQDAPELYKPSELGWIPKSWEVEYLTDLSESGLMNGVFKEPSRVGKGIPLVNVADLYKGEEVSINTCELFDATEIEKERYDVKRGDIFFTRSSLKLEGIAHTSFINCDCESVVFECHVMRLRPNLKKVIPLFLKEWCVGTFARKHFMANAKQVTMTTISQDGIRNLPCPKPIIEEQYLIEKVICGFEGRVTNEISSLKKLKAEKSGLMDDLLTGKKCVIDILNQQQAS
jgi:type I restriction enzyme S subunit